MLTLTLDIGWYWAWPSFGPVSYLPLGLCRLGLSIPALDKVLAREAAAARRALGRA